MNSLANALVFGLCAGLPVLSAAAVLLVDLTKAQPGAGSFPLSLSMVGLNALMLSIFMLTGFLAMRRMMGSYASAGRAALISGLLSMVLFVLLPLFALIPT